MPKITALPFGPAPAAADVFPFVHVSSGITDKITFDTLQSAVANAGTVQSLISGQTMSSVSIGASITAGIQAQATPISNTVSDLKALSGSQLSGQRQTLGYLSVGDGGGALFRWNGADVSADNGGTIFSPNSGGIGRWNDIYLNLGVVKLKNFGAVGDDNADDSTAISKAVATGKIVELCEGTFKYSSGISLAANKQSIQGFGAQSIFHYTGSANAIDTNSKQNCSMHDFAVVSSTAAIGINVSPVSHFFEIGRVNFDGQVAAAPTGFTTAAIQVDQSFYGKVDHCDISYGIIGVYGRNQCNGNTFVANSIRQCKRGYQITDDTSNSDGNVIVGGLVESAAAGTVYGIELKGADGTVIIGVRTELTVGAAQIIVHGGAGTAFGNQIIAPYCTGSIAPLLVGDDSGSAKVNSTIVRGGWYNGGDITIGVDADYTDIDVNRRSINQGVSTLVNHSVSSIISFVDDSAFSVGITGLTTVPTALWNARIAKNIVELFTQTLNGTSNSTACTITGIPSLLRPVNSRVVLARIQNGGTIGMGIGTLASNGIITLSPDAAGSLFSGSASGKGWIATDVTYSLN